jgi:nucleoside-diphosphate-sugar epimerase
MSRIVVTGADGFIGKPLTEMLARTGHEVIALTRTQVELGDRQISHPLLESAIKGSHAVIHLAGRAHVMREWHNDPLGEFRRTNFSGTLSVAEMAARAGVLRFVFVSSIGVLGNTSGGHAFNERDTPAPQGPYAVSKWETEQALTSMAGHSQLQIAVVRPPLVYGPHVKGNFLRLLRLVDRGVPLPFGDLRNCRSYIGVENLCDFLVCCVVHSSAGVQTFNVSDGEDISTPELLEMIATAMARKLRIFRCPAKLLLAVAALSGRGDEIKRLSSNLRVDSSFARTTLNWHPAKKLRAGIEEMVHWFVHESHSRPNP